MLNSQNYMWHWPNHLWTFGNHYYTQKGYCILNNKHLPLHSDLLRSNSLIVDTYSVILWNLQTISYRWPSLTIEDDSLSNKPLSTKHHNTTNFTDKELPLLNDTPRLNKTFYRSLSAALALGLFCVYWVIFRHDFSLGSSFHKVMYESNIHGNRFHKWPLHFLVGLSKSRCGGALMECWSGNHQLLGSLLSAFFFHSFLAVISE